MKVAISILLSATLLAAGGVSAQEAPTSEEIVRFFQSTADLGPTRGICIGTEEQCKSKSETKAPTGLDMLVNFELNSAQLTQDAQAKLAEFVKALKDDRLRQHRFVVEGHTDATGTEAYNHGLSERRARSVTAFLLEHGVEPERIDALGLGETRPRGDNPYDPLNRRVEMHLNIAR